MVRPSRTRSRGDAPPIVLVHGITESRRSWDPLIEPLAREHRVVAVDLRGHGESERRPPYDALTMAEGLRAVVEVLTASAEELDELSRSTSASAIWREADTYAVSECLFARLRSS